MSGQARRGVCTFSSKAREAARVKAAAIILVNNQEVPISCMIVKDTITKRGASVKKIACDCVR